VAGGHSDDEDSSPPDALRPYGWRKRPSEQSVTHGKGRSRSDSPPSLSIGLDSPALVDPVETSQRGGDPAHNRRRRGKCERPELPIETVRPRSVSTYAHPRAPHLAVPGASVEGVDNRPTPPRIAVVSASTLRRSQLIVFLLSPSRADESSYPHGDTSPARLPIRSPGYPVAVELTRHVSLPVYFYGMLVTTTSGSITKIASWQ